MEETKLNVSVNNALIGNIFGKLDENIKKLEKAFSVKIVNRGEDIVISGAAEGAARAAEVLKKLVSFAGGGEEISGQTVNYLVSEAGSQSFAEIDKLNKDTICLTVSGKPVRPKTLGQKKYVDLMRNNTVIIGVGPAGTGKTYLAMAMAITAFKTGQVNRIILTRPAIEAGEKLGFLPGDLQQKVDPYLRPLYDALHEIMGAENFEKNKEKGLIEVAPLAYMRGRTLDNSFIVLDEAQNTTHEQMKMFLTRIGFGSKAVITGDLTQVDLPEGKKSGLTEAVGILKDIENIGIITLTNKDVVRHPLVQQIINAYEKYESKKQRREEMLNRRGRRQRFTK
ncbi:MAG: PhoH family protein [Clostridiales bacterium]|jgi:phosphate starvation-inducible PhoH-like protein|nr:PhoH family protein [Clostridiales bacterium]